MSKKAIQYTVVFNRKGTLIKEGKNIGKGLIQIEAYKDAVRSYFLAINERK